MLTFKRKPWTLTLLVSLILAISFASVVEAGEFERRDHDVFRRMVKKRSPQGLSALGLGGANDTPVGAAQDPAEQLSAEPSASPPVLSVPPLPSVEPSLIPSISLGLSSESSAPASDSVSQSESQPASQSAAPSSPPPAASTPTPPPSNPTPEPQPPAQGQPSEPGQKGPSTVLHYETMPAAQQSQPPEKSGNTSAARVSMTVIGVIAGVVGAVIVAWTIFRKWKLARSKKFDERLNPIDWQPPSADDGGIPGARRHSTASSFHSGSGHSINRGYGSTMNHNGPLPDHDFTAGASLAPGGGYTDMSRGPSPQPQMMETNMYGTGYGHHDQYGGVPLHHQGYGGPNYYNGNRPY